MTQYSDTVTTMLTKSGVRIGDRIVVEKNKNRYEGLLMPRIGIGDTNVLVLKLDSGYNIGLRFSKDVKVSKSKHIEPKNIREEVAFEMGKEPIRALKFDSKKPDVALIVTGGTIMSRVDYKTGGVAPLERYEELLANIPELAGIVNIKDIITPFRKSSEDLDHTDWQKLAETVAKELNKNEGAIVLHGTDTMHYTSAALSFMLKNLSKPVVLVGSQRSSDRGSSDAWINLICGAYASVSDIAEITVAMHGTPEDTYCVLHRGTRVRKMHTTRRDTFRTLEGAPLAKVWPDGKIETHLGYNKRSNSKVIADTKIEPKVALLKVYPSSEPAVLEWYVSKGYKGFVIEGTGMGHVPTKAEKSWIPAIKKLTKDGIPVVIVAQPLYGRINTNVYDNLRTLFYEAKAIPGEDMLPEVALVKLMFALGHYKKHEDVKEFMMKNIAGEITERSLLV